MRKNLKLGVVTGILIIGAFFAFSGSAQTSLSSGKNASKGKPVSPRSLFVQNCARCHGANGKAQTALGKTLEADDISGGLSTAKIIRTVKSGRGDMPSFRKKLTAAQIKSIAAYVHSL